jgi:hypothetical protein
MGERLLCKQEVTGSIPVGSIAKTAPGETLAEGVAKEAETPGISTALACSRRCDLLETRLQIRGR